MKDRTIVVTGATGYFGRYFVEDLAKSFRVVAVGRRMNELNRLFPAESVPKVALDFYDEERLISGLEEIGERFEPFGLVNNAFDFSPHTGFNVPEGKLESISVDRMRNGLVSGLLGPMLCSQILGRHMIRLGRGGSIVNISSMYGSVAPDRHLYDGKEVFNPATYAVAKSGLNGLSRYIASFWGGHGIRCNSVAPGSFPNVETQSANAPDDEEFIDRLKKKTVLNRVGHPRDLLGIVRLLLSDEGSYITGQTLAVDGGWTSI